MARVTNRDRLLAQKKKTKQRKGNNQGYYQSLLQKCQYALILLKMENEDYEFPSCWGDI